jgi:hypothetical protein
MGTSKADLTLEEGIVSIHRAVVEIPFGEKEYSGLFLDEKGNEWDY